MDIKHGDIITLENGDEVKVSLEVINKKVTELIPGYMYKLRYTGEHCHTYNLTYTSYMNKDEYEKIEFQYVGEVDTQGEGRRYIFFSKYGSVYSMWGTMNLDFISKQITK